MTKRVLTGINTTGTLHIGNYVGAIRPAIRDSRNPDVQSFFFLADLHALIKCQDPARIERSRRQIAATWLAAGLDPDKVYEVSPLDVSLDLAKQDIANGQSPLGWWKAEGVKMTGRALATYGIRPPALHPAQAVLFKAVLAPVESAE